MWRRTSFRVVLFPISGILLSKLGVMDFPVDRASGQQLLMGANAAEQAVIQHKDLVRVADRGGPLRDDKGGGPRCKAADGLRSRASVAKSRAEALSSRMRISGRRTSARAMVRRCRWPPERFRPFCSTGASRPPSLPSTISFAWETARASSMVASSALGSPQSRFSRIVP